MIFSNMKDLIEYEKKKKKFKGCQNYLTSSKRTFFSSFEKGYLDVFRHIIYETYWTTN